jgi:anthranilate phosphoribosyltransferase
MSLSDNRTVAKSAERIFSDPRTITVMISNRPNWYDAAMARLVVGQSLEGPLAINAIRDIKSGTVDEALATAILVALRCKGESAEELTAGAMVLRESMLSIDSKGRTVIDTCGTGGDDAGTFNISTAAALVTAACGVAVVKHGNRAVSSRSGSADLLEALGIPIENGPEAAQENLDNLGFAFCFAPHMHPGLGAIAALRRKLRIRTVFNFLGPLANPARAPFQVIGVGRREMLDPISEAIRRLGIRKAIVVHGEDRLDEVTLSGITHVRVVTPEKVRIESWSPDDFGLKFADVSEIQASSSAESAEIVSRLMDGQNGPAKDYVLANAATALWCAGAVESLRDGVSMADTALRRGAVRQLVHRLRGRETDVS